MNRNIEILIVDDDAEDVELTREAFKDSKFSLNLTAVSDGVEGLAYLRREGAFAKANRPDLVLLDLNMPRKDGREMLREVKNDPELKSIPIVILTTSDAEDDIVKSYGLGANCFVTKPVGLEEFCRAMRQIEDFWFTVVKLPLKAS